MEVVETFGRSLPSGITREGEIILRGAPMRGITDEDPGAVKKFNFSSNARLAPSLGFWITSQGWEDDEAKRLAQEKRLEVAREGLSAQELEAAKDEFETIQKSHNVILHWDFSEDAQRSREGAFWITCIWIGYHGSYSGHEIAFFWQITGRTLSFGSEKMHFQTHRDDRCRWLQRRGSRMGKACGSVRERGGDVGMISSVGTSEDFEALFEYLDGDCYPAKRSGS